jgi:hypothetical protein
MATPNGPPTVYRRLPVVASFTLAIDAAAELRVLRWLAATCRHGHESASASAKTVGWTATRAMLYWQVDFSHRASVDQFTTLFSQYFVDLGRFTFVIIPGCAASLDDLEAWCAAQCVGTCQYVVSTDVVFTVTNPFCFVYRLGFSQADIAMLCKLTFA